MFNDRLMHRSDVKQRVAMPRSPAMMSILGTDSKVRDPMGRKRQQGVVTWMRCLNVPAAGFLLVAPARFDAEQESGAGGTRPGAPAPHLRMERIRVGPVGRGFIRSGSGATFTAWGFNYEHDAAGRLIENFRLGERAPVVSDFEEMVKTLGAKPRCGRGRVE